MLEIHAEVALEVGAQLGEGPLWDDRKARLLWVDILGGTLHCFDPASRADTAVRLPSTIGSVGLQDDGDLVLALDSAFAVMDGSGGSLRALSDFRVEAELLRFNDGRVDPWGRFCAGTMDLSARARGALYCVDASGHVREMISEVGCSNGLDWSGDRSRFYYIDTATRAIDVFNVDPERGRLLDRQRFLEFPTGGTPDGLCLDEEDGVWVALWGAGEVRRYLHRRLDRVVKIPVAFVTSMAFGGENLDELYITTAAGREGQDHAGDLFWCSPGVRGRQAHRFGTGREGALGAHEGMKP